jgi:ribonuclease R
MRPREGLVVGIHRTAAEGQQVEVEDDAQVRWQIDCLGEAVQLGARIRFEPRTGGAEGRGVLVRVLEEERESWVCTLRGSGRSLALVPFGGVELPALELVAARAKGAAEGDRVLVVPEREAPARKGKGKSGQRPPGRRTSKKLPVRVIAVLGPAGDPDADHRALAWKYRLPATFSRRARLEADALAATLSAAELARRVDLRSRPFVTIDPATARDHDDALYAEAAGDGDRLWVAIADVSHFVSPGGFVDAEARRRGNSFYFPDRAIPMLPERLSSELCSLRPDEDRLVLAVEIRISADGEIQEARFHEAVIRSHARLSYEQAADWLAAHAAHASEAADPDPASPSSWGPSLARLARIAERLARHRRASGAIELELPEVEVAVDASGRPVDAVLRRRNPAHGLVEEAMLAANRAVAQALERAQHDTIHRVHPAPDPRRLEALGSLVERLGVREVFELDQPGAIAAMLQTVRGVPTEERIHLATLRAMSQARYEPRSRGHFALQFSHYLHFTSPIRRYADLAVHRSLKKWLRDASRARLEGVRDAGGLEGLAIWLSGRERVAVEAEREAVAFACCALLAGREGELFEAEVTGVGVHGLFVRLDRPAASGLVALARLDRRWRLDETAEVLVDERAGGRIEIGTRLRVRLVHVDDDRGRLAFTLVGTPGSAQARASDSGSASASESVSHSA